jgi:hypothetical protein
MFSASHGSVKYGRGRSYAEIKKFRRTCRARQNNLYCNSFHRFPQERSRMPETRGLSNGKYRAAVPAARVDHAASLLTAERVETAFSCIRT